MRHLVVCAALAASFPAYAATVQEHLDLPSHAHVQLQADGCSNRGGPTITLYGELALGELDGQLLFANNFKLTHSATVETTSDLVLLGDGDEISFPKQPPLGGVGGNPYIWVQLLDENGDPVSDEIYVGRCVQGVVGDVDVDIDMPTDATADITGDGCYNHPGPTITVDGEIGLGGLQARMIFRNSPNPPRPHTHVEQTEASIVILPEGDSIVLPKQPVLGGVGGNPHIWFSFEDGDGDTLGDSFYLGRCNQL